MNKKILNKFRFWECKRCKHIWVSNGIKLKKDKPIFCPNCHSPYWNRKRIKDMNITERKLYKENKKQYINNNFPALKLILKKLTNY